MLWGNGPLSTQTGSAPFQLLKKRFHRVMCPGYKKSCWPLNSSSPDSNSGTRRRRNRFKPHHEATLTSGIAALARSPETATRNPSLRTVKIERKPMAYGKPTKQKRRQLGTHIGVLSSAKMALLCTGNTSKELCSNSNASRRPWTSHEFGGCNPGRSYLFLRTDLDDHGA